MEPRSRNVYIRYTLCPHLLCIHPSRVPFECHGTFSSHDSSQKLSLSWMIFFPCYFCEKFLDFEETFDTKIDLFHLFSSCAVPSVTVLLNLPDLLVVWYRSTNDVHRVTISIFFSQFGACLGLLILLRVMLKKNLSFIRRIPKISEGKYFITKKELKGGKIKN